MWFHKGKLAQAIKNDALTFAWLTERLECTHATLYKIVLGLQAANYLIAKALLEVLGYDAVVDAIDWARTDYAGE